MNALQRWRRELKLGTRTTTTYDILWRAACCDADASETKDHPKTRHKLIQPPWIREQPFNTCSVEASKEFMEQHTEPDSLTPVW